MPTLTSVPEDSGHHNAIFDLAPFPMWIYDLDSLAFLAVNQEAIRHYGYSEEEFLNMTLKDIRPKKEITKLELAIENTRSRTERYKESLFKHKKKDGSIIHVQIKSNLIEFQGKKAEIVTTIDLTDRYKQDKRIAKQKQYLSIIGELNEILLKSDDWSHALNQCFQIVGKSIAVDRIFFFQNNIQVGAITPKLEWVQHNINSQITDPELQNISFCQIPMLMEALEKGKPFSAIVSSLPPSTVKDILIKQNVVSVLILPILVNDQIFGFLRLDDCQTVRKWKHHQLQLLKSLTSNLSHVIKVAQAQQKLMDNEARFRSLVQKGTDLTAIVDAQGNYIYVAPTSMKVLGIPPEEFIGKNAFDFIYKDDLPRVKKYLGKILKKKYISLEPYRFQDAYKNWRWIQTDLTNHMLDPTINGIVANSREVTLEVEKRLGEKLLGSLTKAICQPGSLASCLNEAMKKLIELSKINIGEVWLKSEDNSRLLLISRSCGDDKCGVTNSATITDNLKEGEGLAGYVWKKQKPHSWDKLPEDLRLVFASTAQSASPNTALGIPILYNEEFLGCLMCYSELRKNELSNQLKLLSEIGLQLGPVVKQKIIEEQYRNFFEISPFPQCILGFDGYLKKFNQAFNKIFGYDSAELMNNPFSHFFHQDDKAEYQTRLKSPTLGGNSKSFEARLLTKTGEVKWLIWNGTILPESKIILAVAKDITEKKITQQQLDTTYERLKTAQKIAKLGYWVRDLDSDLSEWSEETYHIYGYTPATFIPTFENVIKTFHPDDRHLIEGDANNKLEPGKVQSFENRIVTATGEIKWVRQEIRLLANDKNIPYRIEGTIQDITETKEYELQLTHSNKRFKLAMEASNEMIWEIDHLNKLIIRSKGYEKSIKYVTSEPFQKNNSWFRKVYQPDRDEVWNSLQSALQNKKETYWSMDYRMISSDGSISYFFDRCFIVRDEKGNPIQSIGCALDVTDSKQQLEKIKLQNSNLREIAWLQSHVIRTPLTRIMSLIYLVEKHRGGGKSLEEILGLISVSANELDKVIHEIIHKTDIVKENEPADFTY